MKIAIIHNQPSGGGRRALHGFCRFLSARHLIDIYTLSTSDQGLDDRCVARNLFVFPWEPRAEIRFGLYVNDVYQRLRYRELQAVNREIAERVDAGRYDLAIIDACRFVLIPPALNSLHTRAVLYAHDGPAELQGRAWRPATTLYTRARRIWHLPFERSLNRRISRDRIRAARAANLVITNSNHTMGRLRHAYGVDAEVRSPGIDVPEEADMGDDGYVLSVGEIQPRKGFCFVIDALATLPPGTRPPLLVVGNGGDPLVLDRLIRRARRLGVDLTVELNVDESRLHDAYRRAAVFAYGSHHEGLGLAPLEALAHGRPVVAVAEGGVQETIDNGVTGFLTSRDTREFGRCVSKLLADGDMRDAMGTAGRTAVSSKWTWDVRGRAFEQRLIQLANSPAGG
jgi:glycosyltransferase involved in cell wall biosynthesis